MAGKAILLTLGLALAISGHAIPKQDDKNGANLPKKEIRDLSYAIKGADTYRKDKFTLIQAIEDSLKNSGEDASKCQLALHLAEIFRPMNTDSSLFYAHKARVFAENLDNTERQLASIAVVDALSTAGLFTEANRQMAMLHPAEMGSETRMKYWLAGRRLFGYMKSYAQGNVECYAEYDANYKAYDDSLLKHLPRESHLRDFIECERMVTHRRYPEAQERLLKLMEKLPQESNLYGMAAFQMAEVCRNMGNQERYAAMLALSAISDVKGCVTEGLALPTLANWLYNKGEFNEAFSFINFALEEATDANARMRAVTIAHMMPLIDEAYQKKINSSRDELMVYFLLVTLLLIATVTLIVVLYRQIKKSRLNAARLAETARRQESYIGNFIGLYSSYADKLNHLAKTVSNKLATGQTSELKKLVESGKFADQGNDDIHKIFDTAFLDIYPDFVADINALLRPEERIHIKTPGMLTPELRIYAFVKLGIDESTRIAQILHYSSNTVYTYRNKMRNKALSRETFDHDVTLIGTPV